MNIKRVSILTTALIAFFLILTFIPAIAGEKLILYEVVITKVEFLPPKDLGFMAGRFIGTTILTFGNEGARAFGGIFAGYIPLNQKVNIHYELEHNRILEIELFRSK